MVSTWTTSNQTKKKEHTALNASTLTTAAHLLVGSGLLETHCSAPSNPLVGGSGRVGEASSTQAEAALGGTIDRQIKPRRREKAQSDSQCISTQGRETQT